MSKKPLDNPFDLALEELSILEKSGDTITINLYTYAIDERNYFPKDKIVHEFAKEKIDTKVSIKSSRIDTIYTNLLKFKSSPDSIRSSKILSKLFIFSRRNGYNLLPHIRQNDTWRFIKNKTVSEAKKVLTSASEDFQNRPQTDVDMTGLKISGKYMAIIGPAVSYALLIYILTLIQHIHSIINSDGAKTIAQSFPWFPLFFNNVSELLTIFTVAFYPFLTSSSVLIISDLSNKQKAILCIANFFLLFFLSTSIVESLSELKQKMSEPA